MGQEKGDYFHSDSQCVFIQHHSVREIGAYIFVPRKSFEAKLSAKFSQIPRQHSSPDFAFRSFLKNFMLQ